MRFYEHYRFPDGSRQNGQLTLVENMADLGALDCLTDLAGSGKEALRRLYISYARTWRDKMTEAEFRNRRSDIHGHPEDRMMDWGVYVHIPFCRQKCFYCDFPSFAGREALMAEYTQALCREIAVQGSLLREKGMGMPATIYIGGGTPTVLPVKLLETILAALQAAFGEAAEFTIEANPGTVEPGLFPRLRSWGVNRLSLGVQSFDDGLLRRIGRIHRASDVRQAVAAARRAGFANISLDLMKR